MNKVQYMGKIGLLEILLAAFIIIFLFGAKKIPGIFKAIGNSIKNFKNGLKNE